MSTFSDYISGAKTQITATDLTGCTKLKPKAFYIGPQGSLISSITGFPNTLTEIDLGSYGLLPSITTDSRYDSFLTCSSTSAEHGRLGLIILDNWIVGMSTYWTESSSTSSWPVVQYVSLPSTLIGIANMASQSNCNMDYGATLALPSSLKYIGASAFYRSTTGLGNGQCYTTLTIPSSVKSIGSNAFGGNASLTTITFNHASTDTITLPTAGSSTGAFYTKTAATASVYTDNQTIHDYDWATDNITATLYHLDGTLWDS